MEKQAFNDLKESVVEIGRVLKGEIAPSRVWKIDDDGKRTLIEDNSKSFSKKKPTKTKKSGSTTKRKVLAH
jgi:hypothetical protein